MRASGRLAVVLGLSGTILATAAIASPPASAELSQERKAELNYLLEQDCGSCHGLTRKGGLGSPLLPDALADRSDEVLIDIILDGIPGTPMPPWKALLSREEAAWLVDLLRRGGKAQ